MIEDAKIDCPMIEMSMFQQIVDDENNENFDNEEESDDTSKLRNICDPAGDSQRLNQNVEEKAKLIGYERNQKKVNKPKLIQERTIKNRKLTSSNKNKLQGSKGTNKSSSLAKPELIEAPTAKVDKNQQTMQVLSLQGNKQSHRQINSDPPTETVADIIVDATTTTNNICAGCSRPIREQFLLEALDKRWHEDCLKCACCECRLGEVGSSLFVHLDKIFCRRDYLRIFGQRGECSVCRKSIEPYELVMRAKGHAYHIECFACQRCQSRFCVGDQFCLWSPSKIVCFHCHQIAQTTTMTTTNHQDQDSLISNQENRNQRSLEVIADNNSHHNQLADLSSEQHIEPSNSLINNQQQKKMNVDDRKANSIS